MLDQNDSSNTTWREFREAWRHAIHVNLPIQKVTPFFLMETNYRLVQWNVDDDQPVYSWEPDESVQSMPVTPRYSFTHNHKSIQTNNSYCVADDRSKPPDMFDPFDGYVFRDHMTERSIEEAIPVRIVEFNPETMLFVVLFSDVREPRHVSVEMLMRIAPELTANYLIQWRKHEKSKTEKLV